MKENVMEITYTTRQLAKECGVAFYTIQYLAKLNKLPVAVQGKRGVPARYFESAKDIVNKHKMKGK